MIIGADGTLRNLRVIDGPPLLFQAATVAVSKWRWAPTLVNGQPVEVETEVDVNFALKPPATIRASRVITVEK